MKCYIGLVNESARGKERDSFWLRAMQGVWFFLYIYICMTGCGGCGTLQGGDWYTRNIIYQVGGGER